MKRITPPGRVNDCMINIARIPNAAAPPTGANHNSVGAEENTAWAGNRDTVQTAARPVTPRIIDTPQRGAEVHSTGQVSATTTTSTDTTKGPDRAPKLGKNML